MRLDYFAHSCFLLQHEGFRVLFDPYDPSIGYPAPRVSPIDLVVVSHDHHDHNGVSHVLGPSQVVRGIARREYGPLVVDGEVGWHGEGADSDPVSLTLLEWNGRRMAHFGDLGCELEPSQIAKFSELDLLMLPVGGGYTIDGPRAAKLVERLRPKIAVPMHYRTPFLSREQFPHFTTEEPFLESCKAFAETKVVRSGTQELDVLWQNEQTETIILNLQHQMS